MENSSDTHKKKPRTSHHSRNEPPSASRDDVDSCPTIPTAIKSENASASPFIKATQTAGIPSMGESSAVVSNPGDKISFQDSKEHRKTLENRSVHYFILINICISSIG